MVKSIAEHNIVTREMRFGGNPNSLIKLLEKNKRDFLIRETPFLHSIIYDGKEITFTKKNNMFPPNLLWIFKSVRHEAEKHAIKVIQGEAIFEMPNKYPVNLTNNFYDDNIGIITGTDIKSAYWTIARNMGVISNELYVKANKDEHKVVRLAALAILGRNMLYRKYSHGSKETEPIIVEGEKILKDFYKAIRYTCYQHMDTLAKMLGNDFDAYRTDCIYYRDTEANRKLVYDYLDHYGFNYKQLVFDEENNKEK
jgi:hypothetical protein